MNKAAKLLIENILLNGQSLQESISRIVSGYRAEMDEARTVSAQYKDEKGELEKRQKPIAEKYKAQVTAKNKAFAKELRETSQKLHKELRQHLTEPVNPAFKTTLDLYFQYGIKPSEEELRALLEMNGNNSAGLRALSTVLERTKAPLELKYRAPEDFSNDLRQLDKLALELENNPYVPVDTIHEALEMLRNDNAIRIREDGTTYTTGAKYDFYELNAIQALYENTMERVKQAQPYWTDGVSYAIQERLAQQEMEAEEAEENPGPTDQDASSVEVETKADNAILERLIDKARSEKKAAKNLQKFVK